MPHGDPDPTDYAGDVLPAGPLENTQIANQSKVDVAINSTSYDDNTDYSDDGDGNAATSVGDPCYRHPAADAISAAGCGSSGGATRYGTSFRPRSAIS